KRHLIGPFCLALAVGAMITVFFWTAFPALGALTYYQLPPETASRLNLALDGKYGRELLGLFVNGPGRISPYNIKGLIGFPSFHLVMAILIVWYARSLAALRVPALLLNLVVLISTPIQGGHHVVDLIGGFMVAALAIPCADWVGRLAARENFAIAGDLGR